MSYKVAVDEPDASLSDTTKKGLSIYRNNIRPMLTEGDKGKYLSINTVTGEWLIDEDDEVLFNRACAQFAQGQMQYFMRIGYRATYAMRPGLNLELPEW